MEALIRYQPTLAPVLEGMVKAGLIEVLEKATTHTEPVVVNDLTASQIAENMRILRDASDVISSNPNFYDEWKKDYDKMREEWD